MTPDAMVTLLKLRLANSNDSSLDADIITLANVVQERLEQMPELPWFLLTDANVTSTNLSTIGSTETVAVPGDFLREDAEQEFCFFLYDTTLADPWKPLLRDNYSIIKAAKPGEGAPEYYDIMGAYIYLLRMYQVKN